MMLMEKDQAEATVAPAVLYVDDEPSSLKYFSRAFERDFPVLTAASVAEAEELLAIESDQVGVLITDQRMPVQTGIQLLDWVRDRYPDIVRLLTTAYADLDDAVAAVNRGEIHRYLLKPWDLKVLRAELHKALDLYRRRRHERSLLDARRRTMVSLASHIAHELSTPLSTIRTAVSGIQEFLPSVIQGYRRGVDAGLAEAIPEPMLELAATAPGMLVSLVDRTSMLIRLLLMNAAEDAEDCSEYAVFPVRQCIDGAIQTYPFTEGDEGLVSMEGEGFDVFGSEVLLSYVFYNLLSNSLDAIRTARKGEIRIRLESGPEHQTLYFRDTGSGISSQALPRIFADFYSGKGAGRGTGMGLSFCRRVLQSFGGDIACRSNEGEYTEMELTFPVPEKDRACDGDLEVI